MPTKYFDSSRRFTGPNLYFDDCGAVIEVFNASDKDCEQWAERVRTMCRALAWPSGSVVAKTYISGASLAFSAPEDQLYTATEVNEWAWVGVACEIQQLPLPHAPGHAAVWDTLSAEYTLRKVAAQAKRPDLIALLDAARQHGLPAFHDDEKLSIGAGEGSCTWALNDLPETPDWSALHDIPTALVTGSNGKTTTVRLVSAICAAAGKTTGHNCTDGVFIDGERVETGDYSGPTGARRVLRNRRVQTAVIETARGGLLRRGLAVRRANAAIITNISPDHFGEYGVHDLSDLADAKLVLARAMGTEGVLVLNADDAVLVGKSPALSCQIAWIALDNLNPLLVSKRAEGGSTCGVHAGRLYLHHRGEQHDLGEVEAMPLTAGGAAQYNIANIAGASLLATLLGAPASVIAAVLARFGRSRDDNPGRLERRDIHGVTVLVDYAHNPDGLSSFLRVAQQVRVRTKGRLGLLLGQAGNRLDDAICDLASIAATAKPDFVVLKDPEGYLRGRIPGEVPAILCSALIDQGVSADRIVTVLPEAEAAQALFAWAKPMDVLVLPVHSMSARDLVAAWLDDLERSTAS